MGSAVVGSCFAIRVACSSACTSSVNGSASAIISLSLSLSLPPSLQSICMCKNSLVSLSRIFVSVSRFSDIRQSS